MREFASPAISRVGNGAAAIVAGRPKISFHLQLVACASFTSGYVDDLIDALIKLMATQDRVTGPINIGNPSECSMIELAAMIIELTGSRSRTVHRPLPENDPRQRRPDISRAQELLAWAPHIRLRDGLIRTISYFEKLLSENEVRAVLIASEAG